MRAASLARRGLAHMQRRGQQQLSNPSQHKSVKEFDEEKYGGWKSAEILFSEEPQRRSLVGRWDWHVVQFLLALVPPGMVLLLVQWARHDMAKTEELREHLALSKESEKLAAVVRHQAQVEAKAASDKPSTAAVAAGASSAAVLGTKPAGIAAEQGALEQRLSRVEALLAELQAQQAGQAGLAGMSGQAGQQLEQQAGEAQLQSRQQQAAGAAPGPRVQQEQEQQEPLLHRLTAGAWRYAAGWWHTQAGSGAPVVGPAKSQGASVTAMSVGGSSSGIDSSGHGRSRESAGAPNDPSESSSSSTGSSTSQGAAAASTTPSAQPSAGNPAPSPHAAQQGPASAGQPGNTANRILHAVGQPLRWLRQKTAPTDGAEPR